MSKSDKIEAMTERAWERYVSQYKAKEAIYGSNMADVMYTKREFISQRIRTVNTAKANISQAMKDLERASSSERADLQEEISRSRNILKNPIREIVSRQTYSTSRSQAESISRILKQANEEIDEDIEVPSIRAIRTTRDAVKTLLDKEGISRLMSEDYRRLRSSGVAPKEASRRVWRSFGGS